MRLPDPKTKTEGGIELPGDSKQPFFYGRIESIGCKVIDMDNAWRLEMQPEGIQIPVADTSMYAVFDPQGVVPIQLDPLSGASKVAVLHREQVFATITADELAQMNLPLCADFEYEPAAPTDK